MQCKEVIFSQLRRCLVWEWRVEEGAIAHLLQALLYNKEHYFLLSVWRGRHFFDSPCWWFKEASHSHSEGYSSTPSDGPCSGECLVFRLYFLSFTLSPSKSSLIHKSSWLSMENVLLILCIQQ